MPGPIAIRHLADHGAIVIRIRSRRVASGLPCACPGLSKTNKSLGPRAKAMLNCSKMSVALNLSDPRGVTSRRRLIIEWGRRARRELHAPKAMKK